MPEQTPMPGETPVALPGQQSYDDWAPAERQQDAYDAYGDPRQYATPGGYEGGPYPDDPYQGGQYDPYAYDGQGHTGAQAYGQGYGQAYGQGYDQAYGQGAYDAPYDPDHPHGTGSERPDGSQQ
jgi:hypothetical protein